MKSNSSKTSNRPPSFLSYLNSRRALRIKIIQILQIPAPPPYELFEFSNGGLKAWRGLDFELFEFTRGLVNSDNSNSNNLNPALSRPPKPHL